MNDFTDRHTPMSIGFPFVTLGQQHFQARHQFHDWTVDGEKKDPIDQFSHIHQSSVTGPLV
jgi:hypothetical protein